MLGVHNSNREDARRSGSKSFATARAIRLSAAVLALAGAFVLVLTPATFADYADGGRTEQMLTLPDAVKVWRQEAWQRDDFLSQVRLGDLYSANQSIGASESKNAAFIDPVEAYVWYFMALRPGRDYRIDDNMNAADNVYNIRNNAITNAEQIYSSLTFEQRLDARARLLYILSSRGAEGFLTLGRIHGSAFQGSGYNYQPPPTPPPLKVMLCLRSSWNHWYSGWLWWLWASVTGKPSPHPPVWKYVDNKPQNWRDRLPDYQCIGAPVPPPPANNFAAGIATSSSTYGSSASGSLPDASSTTSDPNAAVDTVPPSVADAVQSAPANVTVTGSPTDSTSSMATAGASAPSGYGGYGGGSSYGTGYGSYGGGYGGGYGSYYGGRTVSSVFVANSAEALTYFLIAQKLGHPLAGAYVANERAALKYSATDAAQLVAEAERRARFWTAPYEYYPGVTAKGEMHSDESLPSVEARLALRRIREVPVAAVVEALDFRGYRMHPRLCGPPPVCLTRASTQFQTANNWEPTGYLTPLQTVRLIQMAAVDGDAIAQDRLGIMYAKGIGVEQNFVRAEKWFIKSANQRYPDALYNLSVLYRVGPNGVEPDEHKSNSYRAQAEAAGYASSRCELLDLLKMAESAGRERSDGGARK